MSEVSPKIDFKSIKTQLILFLLGLAGVLAVKDRDGGGKGGVV